MSLPESRYTILGLGLWQFVGLFLALIVAYIVGALVRAILTSLFRNRYSALHERLHLHGRRGVGRSIALIAAGYSLSLSWDLLELKESVHHLFDSVADAVILAGFVWLAAAFWNLVCDDLAARSTAHEKAERLLIPLTRKLVQFVLLAGGFMVALAYFGVNVTGLLAGLGLGGLVIALAAKDSVENVFGSLTVLLDMPFALGDWVKIGDVEGVVEEINLRSTRIRTFADSLVTLPNSNLIKAAVENMGRRRYRRFVADLIVAGSAPTKKVKEFIARVRSEMQTRTSVFDAKSSVSLSSLRDGQYVVALNVYFESPDLATEQSEREDLLLRLADIAREVGVELGTAAGVFPRL